MWPTVADRRPFLAAFTGLVALMWVSLWIWGHSPYARFLSHKELGHVHGIGFSYDWIIVIFVAGWTLMIVAMMLPTSLPLVALFHSFVRQRPDRIRLTALLVVGYLATWTLFGLLVHVGDRFVHQSVERSAWLSTHTWVIATATILLAGLYQFTPLKYKCLDQCRSPLAFIMQHWHGRCGGRDAVRLGMHHGLFCLGCCWSLMMLMFAVGVGNIAWMLAIGAVMAIEKNAAWGWRLSAPLGAALLAWGAVLIVTGGSYTGSVGG